MANGFRSVSTDCYAGQAQSFFEMLLRIRNEENGAPSPQPGNLCIRQFDRPVIGRIGGFKHFEIL